MENRKPIAVKPRLYAMYFQNLMEIARDMGYNLLISGSMNRDLDLVAVPWIDNPKSEMELIQAFDMYLRGESMDTKEYYMHNVLSGGRSAYVINLNRNRDSEGVDLQYYIDISITPNLKDTINKQMPIKPQMLKYKPLLDIGWKHECPTCSSAVGENKNAFDYTQKDDYCSCCGQVLDWN